MDVTNPYAALEQGADDEVNGRTFWLKWFGVLGGYVSFTTLVMAATMQIVWNFIIRPSDYDDCMDNYRASESLAKALGLPNRATDCHQFRYEQWWSFHPVGFESWVGLVIIGLGDRPYRTRRRADRRDQLRLAPGYVLPAQNPHGICRHAPVERSVHDTG
jgi:hypothetical protein